MTEEISKTGKLDQRDEAAAVPETPIAPAETFALKSPVPSPEPEAKKAAKDNAKPEEASQSPFSVIVGRVYDGPLDLLLDLIRKQNIDIYDIPIARITAQYLEYVENMKHLDVEIAAEFIYTASVLIHIKSKMLLPCDPDAPPEAQEDPRNEL